MRRELFFERLMNKWMTFVALPIALTESSSHRAIRILGVPAFFLWMVLLACFGPLVLGTAVVLLFGCCVESAMKEPR